MDSDTSKQLGSSRASIICALISAAREGYGEIESTITSIERVMQGEAGQSGITLDPNYLNHWTLLGIPGGQNALRGMHEQASMGCEVAPALEF